jgi:hypothetical protein
MENELDAIARRHGLRVPDTYRRMLADGADDGALLTVLDFEWLSLQEIRDWEPPAYWSRQTVLVPFAKTGRGDYYAWAPEWHEDGRTPVAHVPRDFEKGTVLAPDLEAFFYRLASEVLAADAPEGDDPDWRDVLDCLGPYLRETWRRDLDADFARARDPAEIDGRIRREIAFSRLDTTFRR